VQWKKNVWDSLILKDEQKEVVQALVSSHQYPEDARNQPEQKGRGLVVLLHGSPGSGKTLTAETSAEGTQRALLSASLGDLNKENMYVRMGPNEAKLKDEDTDQSPQSMAF
jgi:SpoVK/Ycf46/Vps4 family AAA+-type ATPase